MNVLHLISSGGMYGAEAVILNLSRTLNQRGHRSIVASFDNSAQPNLQLYQAAARESIESHAIPCNGQLDTGVPARLRSLVRDTEAQIVHAHGYKADVYAWLALCHQPTALVSTCHTWYDTDFAVRLYGALDRFVLRSFAGVVAVSEEVRQRLLSAGVREQRVHLIRNGIDLRPFGHTAPGTPGARASEAPLTVGLVGRLSTEKGVDLFLRAAASVLAELPQTQFVVIGEGPGRTHLEALIAALGISAHARLAGRCENMPQAYSSLDLMVSASRQEGLPIALLEGMASRLPVIATTVGAVPTLIQNGATGILVPPIDPAALHTAIVALLQDPTRRTQLGEAARAHIAAEFSAERMADDYLQLYRQVVPA